MRSMNSKLRLRGGTSLYHVWCYAGACLSLYQRSVMLAHVVAGTPAGAWVGRREKIDVVLSHLPPAPQRAVYATDVPPRGYSGGGTGGATHLWRETQNPPKRSFWGFFGFFPQLRHLSRNDYCPGARSARDAKSKGVPLLFEEGAPRGW